jgi:LacI family transcriptional regulator
MENRDEIGSSGLKGEKQPPISLLEGILLDPSLDLPIHAQLRRALEQLITNNFHDGSIFFSETELVERISASQGTIRRALADLAEQGILERKPARCTIVRRVDMKALTDVAIFLPEYSSPLMSQMFDALSMECLDRDIQLHAFYTRKGEQLTKAYKQLKFSPDGGGAILMANLPSATLELAGAMREKRIRCVNIDTLLKDSPVDFVGVSNDMSIEVGMEHLYNLGHRNVVFFVDEPMEHENTIRRIVAFERYCQLHPDMALSRVFNCHVQFWEDGVAVASAMMESIWESPDRPTAIFSASHTAALVALRWLGQHHVAVPGEVSVLAFDDTDFNRLAQPALTSLARPFKTIAEVAFRFLADPATKPRSFSVISHLIERESTGPGAEPVRAPLAP